MAHLVNFSGTDTFPAVCCARQYYNARMPGTSIPASEHSTMTAWGKSAEVDAMGNMLNQFPTGLMACVSDSFNIWSVPFSCHLFGYLFIGLFLGSSS